MGQGPNATYQATRSLALCFWKRRFFKGFYHIWAWRPPWSCDPDPANKLSFPYPTEAPYEICLWLAQRVWRRRSLKMVDGRRTTDDGACLYYKLTNEPKGSDDWAKNTSWLIKQLFHAFVGNNQNHRSLGAVDDLMHCCPRPNGLGQ